MTRNFKNIATLFLLATSNGQLKSYITFSTQTFSLASLAHKNKCGQLAHAYTSNKNFNKVRMRMSLAYASQM